jgi:serine/threonine protein phosphatase 1
MRVRRWFGSEQAEPVKRFVPAGERVYCIGDIHGRLDLLQSLHERILEDSADFPGDKTVVYLGDYIDRGEGSREIIDLLIETPLDGFSTVHLLGNHEQSLLDFLDHPRAVAGWLHWGGRETLLSYGIQAPPVPSRQQLEMLRDELETSLPESHFEFYSQLALMHQAGNYCFVHAGIRPGIPLQEQRDEDLLWIREDFTESKSVHEKIIVHGHTISPQVEQHPNRIGIDTGAYATGVLTCLVLENTEWRLIQTAGGRHAPDRC